MDDQQELGWLIRDNSNRIRGPYKQAEIVQLIKKGQLKGKTEVSRANSYWFAIEEKMELGRFLPEFNGGRPPQETPTQMTATLTEADLQDHGLEATTFTAVPKPGEENPSPKNEGKLADGLSTNGQQIEWLSEELAEEFGNDFGVTISVQTDVSALNPMPAEAPQAPKDELEPVAIDDKTPVNALDEKAKQEMLRRATVKADTLPSEHRSFQGDRPKPINTLMRSPNDKGSAIHGAHSSAVVNVPVEPEPAPKMFSEEEESKAQAARRKHIVSAAVIAGGVILAGLVANFFLTKREPANNPLANQARQAKGGEESVAAARQSIILFDLEGAKNVLADLETEPGSKAEASLYLAQAVVKKEFLFDVEGAVLALQTAKAMAKSKKAEAEVENLQAVYSFERDPQSSTEMLRRNLESNREDPVFQYNLALSLLRTGKPQEAIPLLDGLLSSISADSPLVEDAALAQGWALEAHCASGVRDQVCRRNADAEESFLRALQSNPQSAKARLGLALFRLRRGGIKASESDFRLFLDAAPDLDPPSRIMNFRKLSNSDFYTFARSQMIDLNTPGQNMNKPSPLIMAADAIISCMQGRTSEAGQILAGALSSAPGEVNVLKALGYLRWKDGNLNELVNSLKDIKDRNSFAVNLMLGKAYLKLRKRELAEKHLKSLVDTFPNRSEGHSLLGEMLLEQPEKIEDAKNEFHLALKRDPLDLAAWRGLQKANAPIILSPEIQKNLPF